MNLFKVQASLRLDKDDDMPDAYWQMIGGTGIRRMKDENSRELLQPLSLNGLNVGIFDNREMQQRPGPELIKDPARRPFYIEWCGPELLNPFLSLDAPPMDQVALMGDLVDGFSAGRSSPTPQRFRTWLVADPAREPINSLI